MPRIQRHAIALGLCCALGSACKADREAEKQAAAVTAFTSAAHSDPDLSDSLGRALVDQVLQESPGWVKEGKLLRGTLAPRGRQAFLVVLKYGHCYRFLGVAEGVNDLDLVLYDSAGVEQQRDVTQSSTPVLGVSAAICPPDGVALRIEARARSGNGEFAIGLLHDPDL